MQLKIKKLSDKAVMPVRAHLSDAGFDLTATSITTNINECGQLMLIYHTDIAVEIPEGHVGLLFPRSSVYKKSLAQTNSVGVVDSGYRGEIMVIFKTTTDVIPAVYKEGERFAQLVIVPIPTLDLVEVETLSEGDRDTDGFGSTGDTISAVTNDEEVVEQQPAADSNIESEIAE